MHGWWIGKENSEVQPYKSAIFIDKWLIKAASFTINMELGGDCKRWEYFEQEYLKIKSRDFKVTCLKCPWFDLILQPFQQMALNVSFLKDMELLKMHADIHSVGDDTGPSEACETPTGTQMCDGGNFDS